MSVHQKYQEGDPLVWMQVHNVVPIVIAIVAALGAFFALSTRVSLVEQGQQFQNQRISGCEKTGLALSREVKGIATVSATLTPSIKSPSSVVIPTKRVSSPSAK
jgi:hypothetical protein